MYMLLLSVSVALFSHVLATGTLLINVRRLLLKNELRLAAIVVKALVPRK